MGALNVTFIRVILVTLTFGLALLGQQPISRAATLATATPAMTSTTADDHSGCGGGGEHGVMSTNCTLSCCSGTPALPVQGAAFNSPAAAIFFSSAYVIGPGIAAAPDLHPPRPPLHS